MVQTPGQSLLGLMNLSINFLRVVQKQTYNGWREYCWGKLAMEAYLKSCKINEYRIEQVVEKTEQDSSNGCKSEPDDYEPEVWNLIECFE